MNCKGCLHEAVCSNGNCRCEDYTRKEGWLQLPCIVFDKVSLMYCLIANDAVGGATIRGYYSTQKDAEEALERKEK